MHPSDFRYAKEVADGSDHVLVFRARVGEKEAHGADFLHVGADGLIDEPAVMVRPAVRGDGRGRPDAPACRAAAHAAGLTSRVDTARPVR